MYATTQNELTLYRFDNMSRWAGVDTFVTTRTTAIGTDFNLGLYAGGDAMTGAATVILAMGAGKRSAKAIIEELRAKGKAV